MALGITGHGSIISKKLAYCRPSGAAIMKVAPGFWDKSWWTSAYIKIDLKRVCKIAKSEYLASSCLSVSHEMIRLLLDGLS